ncbi:response regulator [Paraburkholderia sp. J8-2]|uniref:response regulator n=1 Tax=Paraburkholderia sp. J8-2 TaxID=2805440 RepID=UPI002AB68032|nr:response regulator [Paraburkholderia sp. J8-2]
MSLVLPKLSVYLAEDSALVLRRLVALLESPGLARVVGVSDDATVAFDEILRLRPDVVVADLHLRVGNGLELIGRLNSTRCTATKIMLTNHAASTARRAARIAGADFFFDKTTEFSQAVSEIGKLAGKRSAYARSH